MVTVALVTLVCVMAIHMGLVDAVGDILHYRFRILSCVKCSTFWATLVTGLFQEYSVIASIATAFAFSYLALWLDLGLALLSSFYNRLYEKVNAETDESSEDSLS